MADLQDHHVAPQETKIQEHRLIVALKNAGLFDPEAPDNKILLPTTAAATVANQSAQFPDGSVDTITIDDAPHTGKHPAYTKWWVAILDSQRRVGANPPLP